MFESVDTLDKDLRRFTRDGYQLPGLFRLGNSEVGKALLQLAAGKSVDALASETGANEADIAIHRNAASQFVSGVMLAAGSDHFTTLGVSPDADSNVIRDNFRRLMALVHPDAKPVGFPSDAASRVNRAYAVLSEPGSRAAYAARELGLSPFSPVVFKAEPIARRMGTTERESGGVPSVGRLSGLLQTLRARQSLLWIAALLLLPLGAAVTSFFSYEPPQQLVEGRPNAKLSPEIASASLSATAADVRSVGKTGLDSRTASAVEPTKPSLAAAAEKLTASDGDQAGKLKTPTTAELKYSFALQDIAKTVEPAAVPLPTALASTLSAAPTAPLPARKAAVQAAADAVAKAPPASLAPVELTRNSSADAAPAPAPVPAAPTMTVASAQTAVTERVDASANRVKPSDAEAMVIRFSNAYESGSISAFGQLFAPGMSSRRQMLSDYERVFSATRQRTIKFNQLKHAALGERLATSGYAVVTTTDQDNRIVTQRVFLEFEIGRDRGEPRIERLANYVIN